MIKQLRQTLYSLLNRQSLAIFYIGMLMTPSLFADDNLQNSSEIRQQNEKILSSSEFRHLRWVKQQKSLAKPLLPNNSQPGSSGDGSGSADGSGDQQAGSSSETSDSSSNNSSSSSSDSNLPDLSGAAGAGLGLFSELLTGLFWIVVAGVVLAMLYFIIKAIMEREKTEKETVESKPDIVATEEPEQAPGELPPDAYIARALELNKEGRHAEAIGQLLLGAMSKTENSNLIRFRRGLTFRDYLRSLTRHEDAHRSFRQMMRVYEPIWFGRRPASAEQFELSLSNYKTGFTANLEAI